MSNVTINKQAKLSEHFKLAELCKTSVKTKDGNIPSHVAIETTLLLLLAVVLLCVVAELQDEGVGEEELDLCCVRLGDIAFLGDACHGVGLQDEFAIIEIPVGIALQGGIDYGRHVIAGALASASSCCHGEVALQAQRVFAGCHHQLAQRVGHTAKHAALHALLDMFW